MAAAGLVIAEVPSFEHSRIHGTSNLNTFADGRRVLRTILAERRRARTKAREVSAVDQVVAEGAAR